MKHQQPLMHGRAHPATFNQKAKSADGVRSALMQDGLAAQECSTRIKENDVWSWLAQNTQVLSLPIMIGKFVVWWGFMQILLNAYRRQRSLRIIINQGHDDGINGVCIVSNMSEDPVYIESFIGVLETSGGTYECDLTDLTDESQNQDGQEPMGDDTELRQVTQQGPLSQGQYVQVGTFRKLMTAIASHHDLAVDSRCQPGDGMEFKCFELRLVAVYGVENHPVGARRSFQIDKDDSGDYVLAAKRQTEQLRSRRKQKVAQRWAKDML